MKYGIALVGLCCFAVQNELLWGQADRIAVFEYEIQRLEAISQQLLPNKMTIYRSGSELLVFLDDMLDKSIVPKPFYRSTITYPYGAFYFDEEEGRAVWVRVLDEGDTIRAELEFEPEPWEFLPDTATISGFFCRKARRLFGPNFMVYAWYTEDLGVHAMPKDYLGLPGVLVRSTQYHTFELRKVWWKDREGVDLVPDYGREVKLKRLLAAKSRAQKLIDVMPIGHD